jgi:hypothetical protein
LFYDTLATDECAVGAFEIIEENRVGLALNLNPGVPA